MFKILIVDDENNVLNGCAFMIKEILNIPFPLEIHKANSVPAALDILKDVTPDLILTDIRMPLMDGFCLIEKIKEMQLDIDIIILTSHADFDYARRAIKYQVSDFILKPINENSLKAAILESHQKQEAARKKEAAQYYQKLLTMMLYDVSASDLLLADDILNRLFPLPLYSILIAEAELLPQNTDTVNDLLQKYHAHFYAYLLPERGQLICLLNHGRPSDKEKLLPQQLHQLLGKSSRVGRSIYANCVHELHRLYANARQRLHYQKAFGEDIHLTETALFSYQDCARVYAQKDRQEMYRSLLAYLENLSLPQSAPTDFWLGIYHSFFQNILLHLENTGITIELPSVCRAPIKIVDQDQLAKDIIDGILVLKQTVSREFSDAANEKLIHSILSYIKAHYDQDISLNNISDAVGMHPNYVCTFIKKTTGDSYLNHLHRERITVAKRLLSESELTIEIISQKVGYNSPTQFSRIFKKYEQITPSAYRDL